ncbi:PA14 domain-containing protein [Paenibacillus xylanexedens]|uniref:PA14 domain-containing protein n=1 Tax=Paenibacillus xylanexedens TaxID=528191 RepID=UPI000F52AB17|nr:PA14 domain-containing protein [Paenibacillus xylanexedens]RPK20058.1 hypothetical protein EDO6_06575 [Paenibacillus xylanexedens]
MSDFRRLLMYEQNSTNSTYADYGEVVSLINDKLINVNMGGARDASGSLVILESVSVEGNYVPKVGDWVTVSWRNGQPVANGGNSNGMSSGLVNINNEVKIVSQTDMANGVINSDHIRAATIEAVHIKAQAIEAYHISANAVTADAISANSITSEKIAANSVDASKLNISAREFGLLGQYFTNSGGSNKFEVFKGSRVEGPIYFDWGTGSPSLVGQNDNFAIRWQGMIFAPVAGQYTFYVTSDEGSKLWVDNNQIIDSSADGEASGTITLSKDTWYPIRLDYVEGTGVSNIKLEWAGPSLAREIIPARNMTQAQTVVDGGTILTNTITASAIKVGTITAASGVIGDAAITNANIANGAITSAKIGNAEIKTAHIASGNITTALIADASITNAKVKDLDAGKITTGYLSASVIAAESIVGSMISGSTITGDKIAVNTIDTNNLRAGAVTATKIAAGAITGEKIAAETITSEKIRSGSISAEHISAKGLDANLINVYNSQTGQVLIGGGYVRVDGLDVGVIQSDNLIGNGLFLTASSAYGMKRDNQAGEAILGNISNMPGAHEVWKMDAVTGQRLATLAIPAKKPVDFAIDTDGTFAYVTVQGDNSFVQVDLKNFTLTGESLAMGVGPGNMLYSGDKLHDMKHFFVINNDPSDTNIPDSVIVVDAPPASVDDDLYVHHWWEVGNTPYDMVLDDSLKVYITQAGQGDIAVVDVSNHNSRYWKVIGNIPISAYMTDNYHGGLSGVFGLGAAVGGDSSAAYDQSAKSGGSTESSEHAHHMHSGYGQPTGSLKQYEPHGIALSSDPDTLYVCDFKNNELLVIDKHGKAPYNDMTGLHSQGNMGSMSDMTPPIEVVTGGGGHTGHTMSMATATDSTMTTMMDMDMDHGGMDHGDTGNHDMTGMNDGSPKTAMLMEGGGPTTNYVRYRIPIGNAPDYVTVKDGKVFVSLQGAGKIAVINEQDIINEIVADREYYKGLLGDIPYGDYPFFPMRDLPTFNIRTIEVGSKPSKMVDGGDGLLYALISAQSQVAKIDTATETFTTINVGPNPKGICFSNDKSSFYVVNHGGSGDLSFVYPSGPYIGDAFLGLEGGISLQGAEFWIPDRSDWIYDSNGVIRSYSTIEFRINEPFLNEGGYVRLALSGRDYQYAQIEQDIYTVTNYSNGNNLVEAHDEKLMPLDAENKQFQPQTPWLPTPKPVFKVEVPISGGAVNIITPNENDYTVTYGTDALVKFKEGIVPESGFVVASYTARNDLYFKPHNGSLIVATENGSSPNFDTTFEIDEFVPKFIIFDNQQTSAFTPVEDGINEQYPGLEYSMMTNRALKIPGSQITLSGGTNTWYRGHEGDNSPDDITRIVDGITSPDYLYFDAGSGPASITLDLGKTYMIGMVHVLRYYTDGRTYHETKLEVSEDGTNWDVVFDSAIEGEYAEDPMGMPMMFMFDPRPVRYIRDSSNGSTANDANHWIEIEAFGDWEVEYDYFYPEGSEMAGQQMATNGRCVVTTDIQDAYVAYDAQIEFTSWWYMTYLVGPQFGRLKVEMPSMGGDHFLSLDAPYLNKIAHRHIMTWNPSENIKADASTGVKAGKHRAIIRQVSGKISLDRFRIEDYQFYARNSLLTTNQTVSSYSRKKIVAEQSKWYEGKGRQSTEGAYDTPRKNPDTGLPDKSVPLKYRFRVKAELSANGVSEERGVAYVTSTIFETGKLHTNWRRSESIDSIPSNKIQNWDANQPGNTGIQTQHLANGAVRGPKILPHAVMDYHISPYARIEEHKLNLKYPTHNHANKMILDSISSVTGDAMSDNVIVAVPYLKSNYYDKSQVDNLIASVSGGGGGGGGATIGGNPLITGNIQFSNPTNGQLSSIQQIDGDLWMMINAYYSGNSFYRIDLTKYAFGYQMQSYNNMVFEEMPGVTLWRAVPSSEKLIGPYATYGGWELMQTSTAYRDFVIGGSNFELDGAGSGPFGRVNFVNGDGIYLTTNAFWLGSSFGKDSADKPAYGIKIGQNGGISYVSAPAGGTSVNWTAKELWHKGNLDPTGVNVDLSKLPAGAMASGNFTIGGDGDLWVGSTTAGNAGQVVVRNSTGENRIQLDAGNTGKLTGVNTYLDANGGATFAGTVSIYRLAVSSASLVTNLNAEKLNGYKDTDFVKNNALLDFGGYGVLEDNSLMVTAQAVPNMTVQVGAGTFYTSAGRSIWYTGGSVALTTSSATYDRIDVIFIRGVGYGTSLEGTIGVATGTPAPNPLEPFIVPGSIKLATIRVGKNVGSILQSNITDIREMKPVLYDNYNKSMRYRSGIKTDTIGPNVANTVTVSAPLKGTFARSITIPAGSTAIAWEHNFNLPRYAITWSSNSPNRHIYWTGKTDNSIILNIDDISDVNIIIDAVITAY